MPIRYWLMGLGNVDAVKQAMSHPQALGQCRHWLRAQGIKPVGYPDTAAAAAFIAETRPAGVAAIAPALSASLYGLEIRAEGIEDEDHNNLNSTLVAGGAGVCERRGQATSRTC